MRRQPILLPIQDLEALAERVQQLTVMPSDAGPPDGAVPAAGHAQQAVRSGLAALAQPMGGTAQANSPTECVPLSLRDSAAAQTSRQAFEASAALHQDPSSSHSVPQGFSLHAEHAQQRQIHDDEEPTGQRFKISAARAWSPVEAPSLSLLAPQAPPQGAVTATGSLEIPAEEAHAAQHPPVSNEMPSRQSNPARLVKHAQHWQGYAASDEEETGMGVDRRWDAVSMGSLSSAGSDEFLAGLVGVAEGQAASAPDNDFPRYAAALFA